MIATPVTTARLVIDLLTVDDAPSVAAYRSDPDVARYQGWTVPYAVEQAAALAGSGQLALREEGEVVGDAMVETVAGSPHAVEIGVTLAPAAQGRGLATEAVVALVDAAFAGGRARAIAYVDVRNEPSQRLFDRAGFRREGCSTTATSPPTVWSTRSSSPPPPTGGGRPAAEPEAASPSGHRVPSLERER